ncbi:hypothetical protein Hanom_Chr10g00910411 [Helianthus anomalus]
MDGRSHGHKPLEEGVTPGTKDKSPPVHGIGLRVMNIEGNNLFPRRGIYSTNNNSVIDGLFEISKPVEVNSGSACEGSLMAAMKDSHANPSGTADKGLMTNQDGVQGSQYVRRDPGNSNLDRGNTVIGQSYAEKLSKVIPS